MNQLVHSRSGSASKPDLKRGLASSPQPEAQASRTNDPQRTMAGILEVALREFADKGLSGARIDEMAAATRTSKRMIYYYFGSKEGLYLAVLEHSYREMRRIEGELQLDNLPPEEALRRLVEFTFDHHVAHEDYIRIVMNENIERGKYLAQSQIIQELNVPAISAIERLYARGLASGAFRPGLDPVDVHASISALTFFNVSNQYSFGQIFKRDTSTPAARAMRRANIVEMVVRFVRA
jgi:AcrR family transcriptional regulator